MSTSIKIIDFLLDLAETNNYNVELRSRPDGLGTFSIKVRYINIKFMEILSNNKLEIVSVESSKPENYLFVAVSFKPELIAENKTTYK